VALTKCLEILYSLKETELVCNERQRNEGFTPQFLYLFVKRNHIGFNEVPMLEDYEESIFSNSAKITKNLNLRQICVKI